MNPMSFYSINTAEESIRKLNCKQIPSNGEDSDNYKVEYSPLDNPSDINSITIKFARSIETRIQADILRKIPNADLGLLSAKVVHKELESSISDLKEIVINSGNWQEYFKFNNNTKFIDSEILKCFMIFRDNIFNNSISLYDLYISLYYDWEQIINRIHILESNHKFIISGSMLRYGLDIDKIPEIEKKISKINSIKCKFYNIVTIQAIADFVFVIMPINNPKTEQYYNEIIKPQINNNKEWDLSCWRSNDDKIPETITDQIYTYIVKSKFIIADITELNPNVMYEIGLAHALNKNILIITQDDHKNLPFDIKDQKAKKYSNKEQLTDIIQENIPIFLKLA